MELSQLGWTDYFKALFASLEQDGLRAGRVAVEHKQFYQVLSEFGELQGEISGKLRHSANDNKDLLPAVGDWVAFQPADNDEKAVIKLILPRKSKISRKVAGEHAAEQVIAANVDYLFIVTSMNNEFNPRRIERYLSMAWESGASPVLLLNKADLCNDREYYLDQAEKAAFGVNIHQVSAKTGEGLSEIDAYIADNKTSALVGSSGVGKSTLINHILGEERQRVQEIREGDHKGRHTTTHRELICLPHGGILIDTPGMREIQLWDAEDGIDDAFEEIAEAAEQCRFRDCTHTNEPGCEVLARVDLGTIEKSRHMNFVKMQEELRHLQEKKEVRARMEEKRQGKIMERAIRNMYKLKGKK